MATVEQDLGGLELPANHAAVLNAIVYQIQTQNRYFKQREAQKGDDKGPWNPNCQDPEQTLWY